MLVLLSMAKGIILSFDHTSCTMSVEMCVLIWRFNLFSAFIKIRITIAVFSAVLLRYFLQVLIKSKLDICNEICNITVE